MSAGDVRSYTCWVGKCGACTGTGYVEAHDAGHRRVVVPEPCACHCHEEARA